ncbi:AlbA family DNA-binding domain-containing protein [Candidatus Hakubella thermalkaliphila]|uniref:ATP-dependent DNA helicase RecG n=3 Tax=Candidatus Hakubella thermalkaliphila TaxID=2754717 RepID=A0A6V8P4Z8_9ACTN|nr:helix-turn-helix domain-containing protein [Candidatus Hakubella thermalkaliphila]GFP27672.1 ATP-dependent DNA helicase RecG [Candidatus Hakubella thermalkaliphila]
MKQEELKKLMDSGESETVEFKTSFDKEVVETSGAFANTKGGVLLIGASDRGEIKGIRIGKETLKDWANQISQSTEPRVIPEIELGEVDGKSLVIIRIKEFPIKPVAVRGRYFRRVGNSNRIMGMQEIAQMHFHSAGMSWDKLPARDASIDDIDLDKVKRYIKRANEASRRKIEDDEKPLQVLEKLELIKEGQPTWAAILLFRKDPQRFLSQGVIHCGRFKEETIVIDDRMIEGTIIEQVDEAMDFIRKNINVQFVMTGRPAREQIWDYPLEALREALINAVCHRDYTIPSNTDVRIYDDKLIVWSPGGLPFGITIEDLYKPHSSVLRNKGIGGIFYDMGWIEQWGSGIDKMRNTCTKAGIPEPQFEEYQGFRVIFRKDVYTEEYLRNLGLNERQIRAVMYVKEKGKITNEEYKSLNEVKRRLASYELNELTEKGVTERIGKVGKGTHYRLRKSVLNGHNAH